MSDFVAQQRDVISAEVESLRGYIARKTRERNQAEALLRPGSGLGADLNHRQRSLLLHAIRHPGSVYEIAGHQAAHRVTYPTARADLIGLVELNPVEQEKRGKAFVFTHDEGRAKRLERGRFAKIGREGSGERGCR